MDVLHFIILNADGVSLCHRLYSEFYNLNL
jgi:hypothetical protein